MLPFTQADEHALGIIWCVRPCQSLWRRRARADADGGGGGGGGAMADPAAEAEAPGGATARGVRSLAGEAGAAPRARARGGEGGARAGGRGLAALRLLDVSFQYGLAVSESGLPYVEPRLVGYAAVKKRAARDYGATGGRTGAPRLSCPCGYVCLGPVA